MVSHQIGTPESMLASPTPVTAQPIHKMRPRGMFKTIAAAREIPKRSSVCKRYSSVFFVRENARATLRGRAKVMSIYRLAYAAKRAFHCPGAKGDNPVY